MTSSADAEQCENVTNALVAVNKGQLSSLSARGAIVHEPQLWKEMPNPSKKRVVIVGAGAAGMSCAATLAKHPDKFDVTLIDRESHTGGQATSVPLDAAQYGASWLNDGVQGGSAIFRHTFQFFHAYGHEPRPVKLQVAFGKGHDSFWTNVFPSPLIDRFSGQIQKLGRLLKWIRYGMPVLGILPIKLVLRLFRFDREFCDKMVMPLLALFLGTGNQTPQVSSVLLERLFEDPEMRLWEYSPDTLLPNLPLMYTFPNLGQFYGEWMEDLQRNKGVRILLGTKVRIVRRGADGVVLSLARRCDHEEVEEEELFDELVLCTPADESKALLGDHATWKERYVLGGVKFYDDLTVTHSDMDYFNSVFETGFKPDLCAQPSNELRQEQIEFAATPPVCEDDGWTGFRPMYYTHSVPNHPDKIEMGFDCTNYQHQFREPGHSPCPPDKHVYQTIFLDRQQEHLWTQGSIAEDKIIKRKWWHQFGHRWQHYLRVVPGLMFINGKNRTIFAGSWTMVNMHEVACVSGIAAAHRLGATYTHFDDFAESFFAKYLLICHGMRYKRDLGKAT